MDNTEKHDLYNGYYVWAYEQFILTGKNVCLFPEEEKTDIKSSNIPQEKKNEAIGAIWRYVITELLGWTAEEARVNMTKKIAKQLKLDKLLEGLDMGSCWKSAFNGDYTYVLQYAFPDEIKFNESQQAVEAWFAVNKLGKYSVNKENVRYKKNFFSGERGREHSIVIMRRGVLGTYFSDCTVDELYNFFGNKKSALKWLERYNLDIVVRTLFDSPLSYFHESLPVQKRNLFFYYQEIIREEFENWMKAQGMEDSEDA